MVQAESSVKYVPYSQERVYNKLSDLNNLEEMRKSWDMVKTEMPQMEDISFDRDSLTMKVQGITMKLCIIEREPCKCIKFAGKDTPVPLNMWVQILPVAEEEAKLKVTVRSDVNAFMKAMIAKPLQNSVEKIAMLLANIPY